MPRKMPVPYGNGASRRQMPTARWKNCLQFECIPPQARVGRRDGDAEKVETEPCNRCRRASDDVPAPRFPVPPVERSKLTVEPESCTTFLRETIAAPPFLPDLHYTAAVNVSTRGCGPLEATANPSRHKGAINCWLWLVLRARLAAPCSSPLCPVPEVPAIHGSLRSEPSLCTTLDTSYVS